MKNRNTLKGRNSYITIRKRLEDETRKDKKKKNI